MARPAVFDGYVLAFDEARLFQALVECAQAVSATLELVARPARRPALTASAAGVPGALQVGTKKRSTGRTKKLTGKAESAASAAA
jgi:hypothetical protein